MSNNRPPRQPPQVPSPMERYNSSNPPTKGPVVSPTNNSTAQVYGEHYRQGHGPDRPPRPSNSTGQSLGQPPSQIRPLTGSMMPPAGLYGESHRGPSAIQSSSRNTRGSSLSMARPLDQHGSQSHLSGPAQRNLHANALTAHGLGTSSPPVQAPRQATRINTAQSGSHPSTRLPASSQVTSRAQAQADPHTEFDAFLQAEGLTIRCYDDLAGSAAAAEAKDEKFLRALEISKLVVKGISIVAEINPIAKVVASAASALLSLEEIRRSNERMVYAILIQINDLLVELFELRHITIGSTTRHTPAFNKLERLMARISDDITQCVLDINSFKERRTFIKIILVTRYEETFKKHTEQFANHRAEFYHVMETLNLQITVRTEALTAKALKKIDDCLASVRSTSQTKVIAYISQVGGIEALINNGRDAKLSEIVSAEIDFSELHTEYNRTSERIGRMETLLQGMHKVVDRIDGRMPSLTGDKEVDLLIKRYFVGWDVDALYFAREFKSTFPEDRNDPFLWMQAFVGPDYSDQIMDAYDDNGSGKINYDELIRFSNARPQGWTLLRWTVCWTVGLPLSAQKAGQSIQSFLQWYNKAALPNGKRSSDFFLPSFVELVQNLIHKAFNMTTIQDEDIRQRVQGVASIPTDLMSIRMKGRSFFLASEDDVKKICDGRVEFWIFSLLEVLLTQRLQKFRTRLPDIPEVKDFLTTQQSVIDAYHTRGRDVSIYLGKYRTSLKSFAFGILDPGQDPTGVPSQVSGARPKHGTSFDREYKTKTYGQIGTDGVNVGPGSSQPNDSLSYSVVGPFPSAPYFPQGLEVSESRSAYQQRRSGIYPGSSSNVPAIESPLPTQAYHKAASNLSIPQPMGGDGTCTVTLTQFRRHIASKLWDEQLDKRLRSMMISKILGDENGTLILDEEMEYSTDGPIRKAPIPKRLPDRRFVRLGDIGYVDGYGQFQPLFNIFDPIGPHEGIPDLTTRSRDIEPLTTFQSQHLPPSTKRQFGLDRACTWTAVSKLKSATILALPEGGVTHTLRLDQAIRDDHHVKLHFQKLSPVWYKMALSVLGSKTFNGVLTIVQSVYVAPTYYTAALYSETTVAKDRARISLAEYSAVPYLYFWDGASDLWYTHKQPKREYLESLDGSKPPTVQCFALSLRGLELDEASWGRGFARALPDSKMLYDLANAPDPAESVRTEDSSLLRAAKKLSIALQSPFSKQS